MCNNLVSRGSKHVGENSKEAITVHLKYHIYHTVFISVISSPVQTVLHPLNSLAQT